MRIFSLETFQRGAQGQCLYMLLVEDPVKKNTMRKACILALEEGRGEAAFTALYLWLYWEHKNARAAYALFAEEHPEIREVENVEDFEVALLEAGELHLW